MNKSVRAKFKCGSIEDFGSHMKVKMYAVYSSTGENADFCKASPSGNFEIMIDKGTTAAGEYFTPGSEYYFDITLATV